MREGEAIFDELRARWAKQIGAGELEKLEKHLTALVGDSPARLGDTPGWLARGLGQ